MLRWEARLALFTVILSACAPVMPDDTVDVAVHAEDAAVATSDGGPAVDARVEDVDSLSAYVSVRALFASRCSGYCHAGGSDIGASLVLAPEDGSVPALIDRPSRQVTRLMLVAPGDPENSYLVRKVEGTMSALPECTAAMNHCGIPMPYAIINDHPAVTLSVAQRDLIRRWILDGAHVPTG